MPDKTDKKGVEPLIDRILYNDGTYHNGLKFMFWNGEFTNEERELFIQDRFSEIRKPNVDVSLLYRNMAGMGTDNLYELHLKIKNGADEYEANGNDASEAIEHKLIRTFIPCSTAMRVFSLDVRRSTDIKLISDKEYIEGKLAKHLCQLLINKEIKELYIETRFMDSNDGTRCTFTVTDDGELQYIDGNSKQVLNFKWVKLNKRIYKFFKLKNVGVIYIFADGNLIDKITFSNQKIREELQKKRYRL